MEPNRYTRFFRSRLFAGILAGVAGTVLIIFIFEAGVAVGYHAATFSIRWGENYQRNFGGPASNFGMDMHAPSGDGTYGRIVRTASSTITIASDQGAEQNVQIAPDTIIRDREDKKTSAALSIGTEVVILGTPTTNGQIHARLIRILPPPLTASSTGPR